MPRARDVLWGFIKSYAPGATPEGDPQLDKLVGFALNYYRDFVAAHKAYRAPNEAERAAFEKLAADLEAAHADASAEDLQNIFYEVGKTIMAEDLRGWFKTVYEVLLGQEQGPRMGSFVQLYGRDNIVALIRKALDGKLA
jgi:lysyl-tRNA synthetase class 1